jgi:hypothetical protein
MSDFSRYQQKVIKNYYDNRENIALQRAQEILTELYLTEGKKRERHWKSLLENLKKLGVGQATLDHLIATDDPKAAAAIIQEMLGK